MKNRNFDDYHDNKKWNHLWVDDKVVGKDDLVHNEYFIQLLSSIENDIKEITDKKYNISLDLGCGNYDSFLKFSHYIKKIGFNINEMIGVDVSPKENVENKTLMNFFEKRNTNCKYIQLDALDYISKLDDKSIDIVFFNGIDELVLPYISYFGKLSFQLERVLKDNAFIFGYGSCYNYIISPQIQDITKNYYINDEIENEFPSDCKFSDFFILKNIVEENNDR